MKPLPTEHLKPVLDDFLEWVSQDSVTIPGNYLEAVVSVKNIVGAVSAGQAIIMVPEQEEALVSPEAGSTPPVEVESD